MLFFGGTQGLWGFFVWLGGGFLVNLVGWVFGAFVVGFRGFLGGLFVLVCFSVVALVLFFHLFCCLFVLKVALSCSIFAHS